MKNSDWNMNDPDWRVELTKLVEQVDYREEFNRTRTSIGIERLCAQVNKLQGKVRILEGKALDAEQDLALNKLGDMSLSTYSRDGRLLRPEEPRRDAINRALNEGYNDGFADGFKEGQKHE